MQIKLTPQQKRLWHTLLFLIRFTILATPLYLILIFQISLLPLQVVVADHANFLLNFFGFKVVQEELIFTINSFTFYIGEDCTGWKSMLFYFALIFAVLGVSLRKRLIGLLFGLPLIYLGNLARIFLVVWVAQAWGHSVAMFIHDWLWQLGLIALVLILWIVWLKWIGKIRFELFKNRIFIKT